mmetsp:Transcript_1942/g.3158  ORF Transcript_1942/g.3158 Transcript_1942/m.3158 type:complete len:365 (+) Transcript_1942:2243-3337(+)
MHWSNPPSASATAAAVPLDDHAANPSGIPSPLQTVAASSRKADILRADHLEFHGASLEVGPPHRVVVDVDRDVLVDNPLPIFRGRPERVVLRLVHSQKVSVVLRVEVQLQLRLNQDTCWIRQVESSEISRAGLENGHVPKVFNRREPQVSLPESDIHDIIRPGDAVPLQRPDGCGKPQLVAVDRGGVVVGSEDLHAIREGDRPCLGARVLPRGQPGVLEVVLDRDRRDCEWLEPHVNDAGVELCEYFRVFRLEGLLVGRVEQQHARILVESALGQLPACSTRSDRAVRIVDNIRVHNLLANFPVQDDLAGRIEVVVVLPVGYELEVVHLAPDLHGRSVVISILARSAITALEEQRLSPRFDSRF